MYSKFNLLKSITSLLIILTVFSRCAEPTDISAIETISFEDGSGEILQITLDSEFDHEGLKFSSQDEFENYLRAPLDT